MAYRGSVTRLPVGMLGFSGSRNPTQLQAGHLQSVEGMSLDGGLMQKEGGAVKFNAVALGAPNRINAGISYSPLASILRDAVFINNGSVLKDTSGTGTFTVTLRAGLNGNQFEPPPYFMMAGGEAAGNARTLFMFSANNQVQFVDGDGAVMADITTPPADWAGAGNFPTFGVLHEGRLWGGGNASDPHRMYYSTPGNHKVFTGAGSGTISIFPGEGERIVGGISFKGLLIIFKYPKGIYPIVTQDPAPAGWRVEALSRAVGGVNQHTILAIDNDVMYMDSGGNIHLLSATNAFGGVETSNVSQKSDIASFMRDSVNLVAIKRAVSVWYGTKQQAQFSVPGIGGSDNSIRLIVDLSAPQTGLRFLKTIRDTAISMWMRPDTFGVYKPAFGDLLGFIYILDQVARNKGGVGYDFSFETANMDLAFVDPKLATLDKAGDFLELVFEPQGDWDLTIQIVWDDVPSPPQLFAMGGAGAPLGTFILDTDILSSTSIKSIRKRIAGSGRRIRILGKNSGLNQNVAISDFYLSFRPMDERVRK